MAEDLLIALSPPVATLRLNRPQRRNALSMDLMQTLAGALQDISSNNEIKVVIIVGEGPVFSAGHDLTEMVGKNLDDYRRIFDVCTELMTSIQRIPQPVIAQVGGIATAAGCQLVASCDLAVASENARFATPGVMIGLFCSTPMVPLTRAIGRKRSMEMLLTGKPIDARTALEWGLINRVVPQEQLGEATRELACEIAKASGLVLSIGKEAFYSQIDLDQPQAYAHTKEVMSTNAVAADGQEGMTAFLEKRPACWTNR